MAEPQFVVVPFDRIRPIDPSWLADWLPDCITDRLGQQAWVEGHADRRGIAKDAGVRGRVPIYAGRYQGLDAVRQVRFPRCGPSSSSRKRGLPPDCSISDIRRCCNMGESSVAAKCQTVCRSESGAAGRWCRRGPSTSAVVTARLGLASYADKPGRFGDGLDDSLEIAAPDASIHPLHILDRHHGRCWEDGSHVVPDGFGGTLPTELELSAAVSGVSGTSASSGTARRGTRAAGWELDARRDLAGWTPAV